MTDRDRLALTAQALTAKCHTLEKVGKTRESVPLSFRMVKDIAGWLTELAEIDDREDVVT